jgi:hypothetical protein
MRSSFILALAMVSQLGATDCGQVIRDPGFDLWCGDQLCTWKIVRGDVKRVDTWHDGDSGVELVGSDAAIAQLSPVNHFDGTCIRFEMIANVDETAEAFLNIDVYGDGSLDHSERLPTANWKPLSYKLRVAKPFTGIRFELAKRGTGKAVFANISAAIATDCEGLTEIGGAPAPLGALCTTGADCDSGMCSIGRCTGCGACAANEVCGTSTPISPALAVPRECVMAGTDELGEQCSNDAECASGICNGSACSTCRGTCAGGETCAASWPNGPFVCSPGAALRQRDEPCATDGDCASGRCNGGVRKACEDNRPCGNDTSCPVDDGLVPGACTEVGIQGGSCE